MKNYDISLLGEYLDEKQKQESDYESKIYEDINNQLFSDFNTKTSKTVSKNNIHMGAGIKDLTSGSNSTFIDKFRV